MTSIRAAREFARALRQTAREIPGFILTRMNDFVKHEQQRDTLFAVVGKDEALLWLNLMGGDVEAALNLARAGYTVNDVMEIREGLRCG